MARLKDGLLGGLSGKIGDVIGYIRYGKAYVKMKTTKPKKKGTVAQLAEREKMRVVNAFVNSMTQFVRVGFSLEAAKKSHSANASAKSYQLKYGIGGEYPSIVIDYPHALVSKGKMDSPLNALAVAGIDGISFTWEVSHRNEVYQRQSRVMLLVYAPGLNKSFFNISGARIMDKTDFMELPPSFKNQLLHAYMAFCADDQKQISNSVYLGNINY